MWRFRGKLGAFHGCVQVQAVSPRGLETVDYRVDPHAVGR
jgi:hypothetical protein